jgi:hypothetical protein
LNNKQKIIIGILIWVLFYLTFVTMVYYHEVGHKAINKLYGLDSNIELYDFGLSGKTRVVSNYDCGVLNTNYCLSLIQAHANHETIGYHVITFALLFFAMISLILTIIIIGD